MSQSFDPDAPARGTDRLQVGMVRRVLDGVILDVAPWLRTQTEGDIHVLRTKIRQARDGAMFVCFCCGHDVVLKKRNGGHHFAHKEKTESERDECLYQQERGPSLADLDRLRYHGQREGPRHIRTKKLIARILRADPRFAEPVVEKRWTSFADGWRKPDVASAWDNLHVVFEAQVSNTYPQIVAERTDFYRKKVALLIWIFDQLPNTHWRTLHADTFCSNSQHLFLVDEECATVSEETGQAHFRIYSLCPEVEPFRRPNDERFVLRNIQKERCDLVPFATLSLDATQQTATLFNVAKENCRVKHKVLCAEAQGGAQYSELENAIREAIQRDRPIDRKNVEVWAALVCAIESLRLGRPVGTRLKEDNVTGVLNLVHDHHPAFFPHLVCTLERLNLNPPSHWRGAWKSRMEAFHNGQYKNGPILLLIAVQSYYWLGSIRRVVPIIGGCVGLLVFLKS